jgi:AcrR family transcriptional regulator
MGRPRKVTTEEILAAARQIFWDRGIETPTADIAQQAGVSEALIFKRFATKQDLFLAAIGIDQPPAWVKRLDQSLPQADFQADLTDLLTDMLAFYQDMIPRVLMMMSPVALIKSQQFVPPPIRDYQLFATFLDRAIAEGHIRDCNTRVVAHLVVGSINNYAVTTALLHKHPKLVECNEPLDAQEFIAGVADSVGRLLALKT